MLEAQLPIRLLLGAIFLISGSLKLAHWIEFHDTFSAMELFPGWLAELISRVLAPIEIALGFLVLTRWRPAVTGPLLLAMLIGFVAGLGVHRLRGKKKLVCGCFADFERERSTSNAILRNLLLLAAALLLVFGQSTPARPNWNDWLLASATAAGTVLSWTMLSLLAETIELVRRYDATEES